MPTSKTRSGYAAANASSPVGMSMAAVMPTTSFRSAAIATSSSEKTLVHAVPELASGWPVSGSMTPMPWKWSATSASACL